MKRLLSLFLIPVIVQAAALSQDRNQEGISPAHRQKYDQALFQKNQGNTAKAVLELKQLIRESPEYYAARYQLASILAEQKKYDEAVHGFLNALKVCEELGIKDYTVFNALGWVYFLKGDYENAEKYLKTAERNLDKLPKEVQVKVLNNLGTLNLYKKEFSRSRQYFDSAAGKYDSRYARQYLEKLPALEGLYFESSQIRSRDFGNCPECKEDEFAASVSLPVSPGSYVYQDDPSCGNDTDSLLNKVIQTYANLEIPDLERYVGPILKNTPTQLGSTLWNSLHGSLGEMLSPLTDPRSNCRLLIIAIPEQASYNNYILEMRTPEKDGDRWNQVEAGQDCGGCRFSSEPILKWTRNGGLVYVAFKNWSHNLTREARITVYFTPPPNWAPAK